MEKSFWDLQNAVRAYKVGHKNDFIDILTFAEIFTQQLQTIPPQELIYFKDSVYDEIIQLKRFFLYNIPNENRFRGLHDRIFSRYLQLNRQTSNISFVFEDLIKGITYFSDQHDLSHPVPIYHRLLSCGPNREPTFRDLYLKCRKGSSKIKLRATQKRIERCYIERLIYNELYLNEQLSFPGSSTWSSPLVSTLLTEAPRAQDDGHVHWLNETKNDFQTCFPETNIIVKLENYVGFHPTKVTITRIRRNKVISTETYIKQVNLNGMRRYMLSVDCYRTLSKKMQVKFQRFEKRSKWIPVNPSSQVTIPPTIQNISYDQYESQ